MGVAWGRNTNKRKKQLKRDGVDRTMVSPKLHAGLAEGPPDINALKFNRRKMRMTS